MPIKVEHVTYVYSPDTIFATVALDDVSFTIEEGSFTGIIGHTGSGKSTLIQLLNGLLKPSSGHILIDDVDIGAKHLNMSDIRKQVGLVFQYPEYQLFEETVALDIAFGPLNLGMSKDEAEERVKEALKLVGLSYEELKDRSPFELSGGQKRRVAIAGVVAMRPKVLILDEPTAGLDPKAHRDIIQMLKNIHECEGNSMILVSHNMGDIAEIADHILVMKRGQIVLRGTPQEVYQHADLLQSIGLELPPTLQLAQELQKKGQSIPASILTMDEAVEALTRILRENKL